MRTKTKKMNSKPLPDLHPEAVADIDAKKEYMVENHFPPQAIIQFLTEVEEIMVKIQMNPTTWSFAEGSELTRKVQLPRFRMTAFYQIQSDGTPVILEICGPGQLPRWMDRKMKPK